MNKKNSLGRFAGFLIAVLAGLAFIALATVAIALPPPGYGFTGGNASGTTLASVIISARSANIGAPQLTHLNVTSDKAGSLLKFYVPSASTAANFTNSTTSLPVNQTNGFASSDIIIIQHVNTDTYERRVLTTFTSSTNLTVTSAPSTAVIPGDIIWDVGQTAVANVPVGNTNISLIGNGLFAAPPGQPVLLDLDGTSACSINAVSGTYQATRAAAGPSGQAPPSQGAE